MRYPEFLKENGTIGFIAPSYGVVVEPYGTMFKSALDKFHKLGYKTVTGPNCYESTGVGKSSSAENCGKEINVFFCNDRSDVIISCGGGETMCEDLPFVDFDSIAKAKPKWYMGYSDNTNLVLTLPTLCDTAAIYAPCASAFGRTPTHEALNDALSILTGEKTEVNNYPLWQKFKADTDNPLCPYNCTEHFEMRLFQGCKEVTKLSVSGRLLGGCLDCLTILCGTKFDKVRDFVKRYESDGILWFIEACTLDPMGIRRCLWQLRNAGWFDTAKGLLFGRPMRIDDTFNGLDRFKAVTDIVGDMNLPMFFDLDIGHLPPMMPIVSGAIGLASAENNQFSMKYIYE